MTIAPGAAESLTLSRPDPFARVREAAHAHAREHQCDADLVSAARAREMAVLVRATRASYVLELGTGLGYGALHMVDGFGRTGRLDTIESDPHHARLAEDNFRTFGHAERVRVYTGRDSAVLSGLNGPYDMVVLDSDPAGYHAMFEDITRLLRTGGLLLANTTGDWLSMEGFLKQLAIDDRFLGAFGAHAHHALAVRLR